MTKLDATVRSKDGFIWRLDGKAGCVVGMGDTGEVVSVPSPSY